MLAQQNGFSGYPWPSSGIIQVCLSASPFVVLYGREPYYYGLTAESTETAVPSLSKWLSERELMQSLVCQHLLRAQERMKRQSDKSRSERQFQVGDWVFLKLQPYVQSSVSYCSNQKLSFSFFGPYRIVERIGAVAYKLALPSTSATHPVFHVSQLKASHGTEPVTSDPPNSAVELQVPQRVLQRRWLTGEHPVEQVLIQWSHMPVSLAT